MVEKKKETPCFFAAILICFPNYSQIKHQQGITGKKDLGLENVVEVEIL